MKKLLFFLMAILLSITGLQAQTVTIGTGTTGIYSIPVNTFYNYSYTQQIFTATEIGTQVGVINSISFQYFHATPQTTNPVTIYLGNTTKTSFASTTDWVPVSAMDQVFTGSVTFNNSGTNNWVTIQFDSPFFWDGTSNIVVAIVNNNGDYTTSSDNTFYAHTNTDYKTLRYAEDTNPINIQTSYTGTREYARNNVQLTFVAAPSCPNPGIITFNNITPNTVNPSWIENGTATQWQVEYKLTSDTSWSNAISSIVYDTTFLLSGLSSYTQYDIRVKSICGAGDESTWRSGTFRTACDYITTLPYSESFDTYGTGSSTYPSCWYKITNNTYPYISTTNYSAPGSMYMYAATGAYNYVITPAFDATIPINTLSAFFKLYKASAAYNVTVGVMSDPTNMATFDSIANLTPTATSSWQIFSVNFANYTGTGHHIAFKVQGFSATNIMYMDEFVVRTTPTCNIPTGLTRTASTANSMDLDWNAADDANCAGWIVEYKPYDDLVWLSEYTTTHPFTISNLISNVVYRIRVKAVCVSGDTTLACDIVNYGLPCEPISNFPWYEGFENVWFTGNGFGGTSDSRPWCWYNVNGGASASYLWRRTTTASYVRSGLASLQMYTGSTTSQLGDWMISPAFTFTGNERIKFWAKGNSTSSADRLTVKIYDVTTNNIVDAVADTSLFVTIMPNTIIPATTWTQYEINLSQYVGNYQIAFVRNTTGGNYLNIDDITIDAIPSCPDISELSVLSSTASTATLNWTYINNANVGFEISYANVNSGFDPNAGTIITVPDGTPLPYVFSNLTPGQFYSFAVRQACGGAWSNIVVTNTDGAPATLPYSCDFSDLNEQASWKISNGNATNKFYIGIPSNVIAPISGENLYISNTSGATNNYDLTTTSTAITSRLIEFDGSGGYKLKFDLYIGGESSYDYVKVFLTDPDTNFVGSNSKPYYAINSYNGNNQLMRNYNNTEPYFNGYNATSSSIVAGSYPREIILPFQGPAGTVKRLIILWANDGGGGTQPPASIDNIVLEALTCPIPTNIATANLTTTSSDIVWTDPSGTATEWIVKWKPTTATTWDIASSNATTYSLTNLTLSTAYNVSIATVCGTDTSVYATFYFATPCVDITIPYTQNFDAASGFPTCWTRKVGASNPTSSTSYLVSSPNSLYFYASSTYQFAATPPVDINVAMNTLQVSFKMYRTTASYVGVKVGIMTDPNNIATFEQIGAIVNTSQISTWEDKTVLFNNYTGTGRYIAFICDGQTAANGFYLDNIEIAVIPTCPRPTQLTVSNIQANTVELNWLENGIATTWNIEYGPTGFTQGSGTLLTGITTMPYLLGGLTPQTTYQFYVQADCGGSDLSLWSSVKSFTTACLPISALPWSDYFDTYGTGETIFPACWTRKTTQTDRPYINTTNFSSPGSMYFYAPSGTYNIASTPMFDSSIPINTLQASFKYRTTNSTDSLYIGVMSDPSNPATFVQVAVISNSSTSTWYDKEVNFSSYTGTGQYIAFKNQYTTAASYAYVDNLTIDLIPSCPKPLALTASTTDVSATLSWTEQGTATEWEVQYDTANFVFGQGQTILVYDTFATIASLTSNTSYKFYVRSICSIGDSSLWSGPYTFKTQVLNPIPFMEPFLTTTTPIGYNITGWTIGSTRGVTGNPGNNIYKNLYSSATTGQFTTANFGPVQSNTVLNFDYKLSLYSSPYGPAPANSGNFIVAVSTDWGNTFLNVDTIENNGLTGYQAYSFNLSSYVNQNVKIKIIGNWISEDYDLGIDNIYVGAAITCFNPTNLSASNITSASANVNWVDLVNTGTWNIQYGPTGFTLGNGTIISNVPASPYNLINLTPATTYQYYVQADCGGGDVSLWVGPYSFTTACLPLTTVPFIEYFDTYTAGSSGTFPNCWTKLSSSTTYPYISSTNFSGTGSLYLYSGSSGYYCHAITPQFDATIPIYTLKAEFKLRNAATDDTLYVGVMTDPSNPSSFELVQKCVPSAITTWQSFEVFFNNYTGTGQYIAFKNTYTTTGTTIYIDNLEIFTIPSCPRPTAVAVSNITSTSLSLDWTEPGSATQWQIQYGPSGFALGTGTVVNTSVHPTNISTLTPSTSYDFYVRSICSAGDTSMWSVKVVGITACVPITTLPWNEGFESLTAATTLPVCWSATNFGTTTNSQIVDYTSYNRVAHTGTKSIYFRYGCDDRFFTPGFQLTAGVSYNFSYWYITDGETGWTTLQLGAYSAQTSTSLVQTINTIASPITTTYTQINATFTPTTSGVYYFGVYSQSNSDPWYITMDDFSLTGPAITCPVPTNLAVNGATASTATATWTAGGSETHWQIAYKPSSSSTWTTALVATVPTYNFSALTPSTAYNVKVRAICSAGDTSAYSAVTNFTTTATPCLTPTNVAATNITDNSTTITWTPGGSETSWQVEYKISTSSNWTIPAAVSTPSIFLQGLQSNTTYNVRVKALCNPGESAFASAQFTTTGGVIPFTIIASASGPGTITPSGNVQVLPGASQLFTFTPNTGCEVSTLLIDNVNIPNPGLSHNFTNVTADHTIQVTFVTVGIEEGNLAQMVQLYPNPTNATIEIRMNEAQLQVKECRVYDIYGKLMSIVPVNADNTQIDATDFAAGVYFIRMNSEMGVITKKFVKK